MKSGTKKDISLAEAGKYGTLNEYAFFDKVGKKFGYMFMNFSKVHINCIQ